MTRLVFYDVQYTFLVFQFFFPNQCCVFFFLATLGKLENFFSFFFGKNSNLYTKGLKKRDLITPQRARKAEMLRNAVIKALLFSCAFFLKEK